MIKKHGRWISDTERSGCSLSCEDEHYSHTSCLLIITNLYLIVSAKTPETDTLRERERAERGLRLKGDSAVPQRYFLDTEEALFFSNYLYYTLTLAPLQWNTPVCPDTEPTRTIPGTWNWSSWMELGDQSFYYLHLFFRLFLHNKIPNAA